MDYLAGTIEPSVLQEWTARRNQEAASARWLNEYDTQACLPFESMKERYDGKTPYAMGDAVNGGWAATNISLYSGSSVGYLAAVAKKTDVDGIFRIDVNATDFFSTDVIEEYLYFNPLSTNCTVSCPLPAGNYDLYNTLTDDYVARNASGSASIEIASNEAVMVALIPAGQNLLSIITDYMPTDLLSIITTNTTTTKPCR